MKPVEKDRRAARIAVKGIETGDSCSNGMKDRSRADRHEWGTLGWVAWGARLASIAVSALSLLYA